MDQARMPLRTGSKVRFLNQRPGAGPRHVRFSPDGRWFAVVNELDSTLALYRTNANHVPTGAPHVLSTLPVGFNGGSTCVRVGHGFLSPTGDTIASRYLNFKVVGPHWSTLSRAAPQAPRICGFPVTGAGSCVQTCPGVRWSPFASQI
jgi:hypothetical protein